LCLIAIDLTRLFDVPLPAIALGTRAPLATFNGLRTDVYLESLLLLLSFMIYLEKSPKVLVRLVRNGSRIGTLTSQYG